MLLSVNIKTFRFPFALRWPKNWGRQKKDCLSCRPAISYILPAFPHLVTAVEMCIQQQFCFFVFIDLIKTV